MRVHPSPSIAQPLQSAGEIGLQLEGYALSGVLGESALYIWALGLFAAGQAGTAHPLPPPTHVPIACHAIQELDARACACRGGAGLDDGLHLRGADHHGGLRAD